MTQRWRPSQRPMQQAPATIPAPHGQPDQSPSIALTPASGGDISPPSLTAASDPLLTDEDLDAFLASGLDPHHLGQPSEGPTTSFSNPVASQQYDLQQDFTPSQVLDPGYQDFEDTSYSYDPINGSTDLYDSIPSGYQPSSTLPFPPPLGFPSTPNHKTMAQPSFLRTPPQSAPSDPSQPPSGKRRRTASATGSSSVDDSQSEAAAHARFFVDRQFQKLSGLATYKEKPVSSLLQWLREHLTIPEAQSRKRARTGSSNGAGPSSAVTFSDVEVDSEFEAVLRKEARKVQSLADFTEKPVQGILNLLDALAGNQREPYVDKSVRSADAPHIAETGNKTCSEAAFLEFARVAASTFCRARTSTTNPNGVLKCLRPDCAGAYDKKKKSSWLRHVAQMVPDNLYACPRDGCSFIDTRPEWVVNHLQNKHAVLDREAAKTVAKQEPFKVPFSGQCGWCAYQSNDWQEFFGTHVYNHLTGEGGVPQVTKEQWHGLYPPQAAANTKSRKRPSPSCRDKFGDSKRSDEPDDDDSDDDHNGSPFPPASGRGVIGTQAYSQGIPSLNATGAVYGQSYQGQMRRDSGSKTSPQDDGALNSIQFLQIRDLNLPGEAVTDPSPVNLSKLPFGKAEPRKLPFRSLRPIHQGSKSTVDAVLYEDTGLVLARKRVYANANMGKLDQLYRREVEVMLRVRHTHVVKLVDYFMGSDAYTLVVQPVADLSLKQYLELSPPDSGDNLLRWQGCLASATAYLHSQEVGICHHDLKPANILIKDTKIHVADFGSSRSVQLSANHETRSDQASLLPTPMTPMYTPPDAYKQPLHGTSVDIYALGIVLVEMLTVTARIPIEKFHEWMRHFSRTLSRLALATELQRAITLWINKLLESGPGLNDPCPGFRLTLRRIHRMTSFDPSSRPTAKEIATWLPDSCEYADGDGSVGRELPLSHKLSELNTPHPMPKTAEDVSRSARWFGACDADDRLNSSVSTFRIKHLSERGRCDSLLSTGSWCDTGLMKNSTNMKAQALSSDCTCSRSSSLAHAATATKTVESSTTDALKVQQPHVFLPRSVSTKSSGIERDALSGEPRLSKFTTPFRSQLKPVTSLKQDSAPKVDSTFDRGPRLELAAKGSCEPRSPRALQDVEHFYAYKAAAEASALVTATKQSSQTQLYLDKCLTGTHSEFWLHAISRMRLKPSQHPLTAAVAREENKEASDMVYHIMLHKSMKKAKGARSLPPPKLPVQEPRARTMPPWIQNNLTALKKAEQAFREGLSITKDLTPPVATEAFYDMLILEIAASLKLLIMLCGTPDSANTALRRKLLQTLAHTDMQRRQLAGMPQPGKLRAAPLRGDVHRAPQPHPHAAPTETSTGTPGPLSAFTIYAGEIQLVHRADDLRATDVKWHAWSSLCHNVPWRSGDDDDGDGDVLAQLRYVARRYKGKHAALAGAALRGVHGARGEQGGE